MKPKAIAFGLVGTQWEGRPLVGSSGILSPCLPFPRSEAQKQLDWIFSYQHPLNPGSISQVIQQPHPDKYLAQIPDIFWIIPSTLWVWEHREYKTGITDYVDDHERGAIIRGGRRKLGLCLHFITVTVNTKLLVSQGKILSNNHLHKQHSVSPSSHIHTKKLILQLYRNRKTIPNTGDYFFTEDKWQ